MNAKPEPDDEHNRTRTVLGLQITLENKVSLQLKLSFIFIVIFSLLAAFNYYFTSSHAVSVLQEGIGKELLAVANTSSYHVSKNFEPVLSRQPFRMTPKEAKDILSYLKAVQKINQCDAVYLILRNKIQSCALSEIKGEQLLCVPTQLSTEAMTAFLGEPNFIQHPVPTAEGIVITAYAPMRGKQGKVAAVIAVEGSTHAIRVQMQALQDQSIVFFVFTIVISVLTSLLVALAITIPVRDLLTGIQRVARGELKFKVRAKSVLGIPFRDEIGELVISFNHMTESLLQKNEENKTLYEEIQKMNRELEQRVKDATRKLESTNIKLVEKETQRDSELKLAQQIQQTLLPQNLIMPHIVIETLFLPAAEVGGDFYAFIPVDEDHLGVVIGDVSGRGIPAALLMTMTLGILQETSKNTVSPASILSRANETMVSSHRSSDFSDFASCFYAMLNFPEKTLTFSRAGHDLPLWYSHKERKVIPLQGEGTFLGIFKDSRYTESKLRLLKGDKIVFYTDGVTTAKDKEGNRFSEENLSEIILYNGELSAKELLQKIHEEILHFTQDVAQADDLALVILEIV